MAVIKKEMVINEVIKKYPESVKVFAKHKVDSCCGGGESIATTTAVGGADINKVMEDLNKMAAKES